MLSENAYTGHAAKPLGEENKFVFSVILLLSVPLVTD